MHWVFAITYAGNMRLDQFFFGDIVYRAANALRGQDVFGRLATLRQSEREPRKLIQRMQEDRLTALFDSASRHCPAYVSRLKHRLGSRVTIDGLQSVQPLTKQELRELRNELASENPPSLCTSKTTGGSTGEPVTVLKTRNAMAWELAATWRGYGWAGIRIGDRQARFWGVPITASGRLKAAVTDFVCHRHRFSAFDFDDSKFALYARELDARRADYFYGYVSMLAALARWYLSEGRQVAKPPRAIVTTSEVLSPDDRSSIEAAFSARVWNEYGCGELGTIAHECEHGSLHINDENMIVEILEGDNRCAPGQKGEIVITELNNTALPLVRYRTGDFGAVSPQPCKCGRTLTVLSTVFGRQYDFIVSPDGRRYHAEFLIYIFEEAQRHAVGISHFKVQQIAPDHLIAFVVPSGSGFGADAESRLSGRIRQLLGEAMKVEFRRVERIARERSGKMRVIVGLESGPGATQSTPAREHAQLIMESRCAE